MKQMTLAEAKAEGLLDGKPRKQRTTRKTAPRDGARSTCVTCGESFTTDSAETKHVEQTSHSRYESEIT